LTLPQSVPTIYPPPPMVEEPPPPPPPPPAKPSRFSHPRDRKPVPPPKPPRPNKPVPKRPVAHFLPVFLGAPRLLQPQQYHSLTVEECLPILDLAKKYEITRMVVPVSEPGVFLDPQAGDEFKCKYKELTKHANDRGIRLFIRNGGLGNDLLSRLNRECTFQLAFDAGIAHLERSNLVEFFKTNQDRIGIVYLHQVLPGLDKVTNRKEAVERAIREYAKRQKEYIAYEKQGDPQNIKSALDLLFEAHRKYQECNQNSACNLGVFQNGDINLIPLLKLIKEQIESGKEKLLIFETVPNLKNTDFVNRYLYSDGLQNRMV
jgi:hypothetical protein